MDNKQLVIYIRQDDELQTIKKTKNEDIIPSLNQQRKQSYPEGRDIKNGILLWREFYKQELIKKKLENPNATHNQLTSMISKKWKKKKQHKMILNTYQMKLKQENNIEVIIQDNNFEQQRQNNNEQKEEIVEKIRNQTFKLIYLNNICELKGETILQAIKENKQFIHIHKYSENNLQDNEDLNESQVVSRNCEQQLVQQKSNDQQDESVINDDNVINFKTINKIMNYL